MRLLPADVFGEVGDGAGADRLVTGVARLAANDRVLDVDEAEEFEVIVQFLAARFILGEAEEEPVGAL